MPAAKRVVVDTNDDKFLDAAHTGKVDCVISGDEDLIVLGTFQGVPILTAARYLARNTR